jgi:Enoyl-(Acyl carrier protein) reductase
VRPDIVVNNAVVRHFARIEQFSPADWQLSLAVNLTAPFHIIRLALPTMLAADFGRIVNMSSHYGQRGAKGRVDYVTTKTGIVGLTRAVALETVGTGITCNAVSPGTLPTPAIISRIDAIAAARGISRDEATRDYMLERQPSGRFVRLEDVGATVAFLCAARRHATSPALSSRSTAAGRRPSNGAGCSKSQMPADPRPMKAGLSFLGQNCLRRLLGPSRHIAAPCVFGTRLVILDEPFQGLAPVLAQRYAEALRRLRSQDKDITL